MATASALASAKAWSRPAWSDRAAAVGTATALLWSRQRCVKCSSERVWRASSGLGKGFHTTFTGPSRRTPVGGAAPAAPPWFAEKKETMPDLAYLALTVACFVALALVVKAVEKL
ncbi:hypothetical protein GCM10010403_18070 [Glycomyces rutgersensis]|uniref:Uncharacterized protein n=1 Tax=Glycomyces rutgersensis TaxID=58115 RepID=A0ABN3FDV8_9ACTN